MDYLRRHLTLPNFFRLLLAVTLVLSVQHVRSEKSPFKTAWGKRYAQGTTPSYKEHVKATLWFASIARAGLAGAALLISLKWGNAKKTVQKLRIGDESRPPLAEWKFFGALGVIAVVALGMRLPRMDHSLWGDEAAAMVTYVHGMWRPVVKSDPQGPLFFEQPTWEQTFFSARQGANNHVLFSLSSRLCLETWRKLTGRSGMDFSEWVSRIPALLAGIGSLVTLALLLRSWGAPGLALLATAFMALHPWHVRYSVEARGYAFALLLIPLFLMAVTRALEAGRWRAWLSMALLEFLLMYSWAGMMYPLSVANLVMLFWLLRGSDRVTQVARWLTTNLLAAMAFISLYAPHVPQIAEARDKFVWIKGFPMDSHWFHNVLAAPFTGIYFHRLWSADVSKISWQGLWAQCPWLTSAGFGVILAGFLLGLISIWKRNAVIGSLLAGTFVAAIICTLHFKFVLKDELRMWYLLFTLPALCVLVAAGMQLVATLLSKFVHPPRQVQARVVLCMALLMLTTSSLWPMNASLMGEVEEDYKGVHAVTRGPSETFDPEGRSKVYTCWLWRFTALYDPRGTTVVRSGPTLRRHMKEITDAGGELYVIVGYMTLAKSDNHDMIEVLNDPLLFEKRETFPSRESIHAFEVYKMR